MVSGRVLRRSRAGPAPVGRQVGTMSDRTDLDAELNRSRRGSEPISVRNSTDLGEGAGVASSGHVCCAENEGHAVPAAVSSPRVPRAPGGVGPDRLPIRLPLPRSPMSPSPSRRRVIVTGADVSHAPLPAAPQPPARREAPAGPGAPAPSPPPSPAPVSAPPVVLNPPPAAPARRAGGARLLVAVVVLVLLVVGVVVAVTR